MRDAMVFAVLIGLAVVAAFCSLAESAIARVSRTKAHHLAQEHKTRAARALLRMVENPAPYANALLLLRLLVYVTGTVAAVAWALERWDGGAEAIVIGGLTPLLFVICEAVPRSIAAQKSERAAQMAAIPVLVAGTILKPVGRVLIAITNAAMVLLPGHPLHKGPFATEEEIREGFDVDEEEEETEVGDRELLHSVFEFGDTVVREVMVPRTDMVAIPSSSTVTQALEEIVRAGYSRIPIYDGDTDNIVGVLYAKDLLRTMDARNERNVTDLARTPLFVPEQKKVAELLRSMQEERIHMAIVVDEYGGTAGLVTIEDLIEEIVGEIVDEYDQEEPLIEPIDERTIRVDAKMSIDEVNELLQVQLPHEEWDTVGGLVFGLTGRVPAAGEIVRYDSLEFRTERVTGRRIQKVVITKSPGQAEPK
ncbi:MAG TPA: hemolysin family protein [Actinomycetota bacterium]|nr:hemolysin family protein [Actinomycetota bacterium]